MPTNFVFDHEFLGTERDWIAINPDNEIGFFSTAGFGPIPHEALTKPLLGHTFEEIMTLPEVSQFDLNLNRPSPGNIEDWIAVARRGIFAFDWDNSSRVFNLIAKPTKPILADQLANHELAEIAIVVTMLWKEEVAPEGGSTRR